MQEASQHNFSAGRVQTIEGLADYHTLPVKALAADLRITFEVSKEFLKSFWIGGLYVVQLA